MPPSRIDRLSLWGPVSPRRQSSTKGDSLSRAFAAFAFMIVLLLGSMPQAVQAQTPAVASCPADELSIRGSWGQMRFRVDIAADDVTRGQGLMFVRQMDRDKGMLFLWDTPRRAQFWMRNTYIPLDMLFVGPDGVVRHVHHEAVPLDETVIDGGEGVLAVLEINGGLARKFGMGVGDQLRHPAFGADAAWPCP